MNRTSCLLLLTLSLALNGCSLLPLKTAPRSGTAETTTDAETGTATSYATKSLALTRAGKLKPGRLVIVQTATSDSETYINVLSPRLKNYQYVVTSPTGAELPVKKYETIQYGPVFYKVDKIHVKDLKVGTTYKLKVIDAFRKYKTVVDERNFSALDVKNNRLASFALVSCMADDWRFEDVIDPMWARLREQKPDFVVLNGDVVYVDSFDFVERGRANEQDIWQRYIDSFQRIPYYHFDRLIPTLATWDDHDYGTNDGDRTFLTKDASRRVFRAFFGSPEIKGVTQTGPGGTYSVFSGFGQKFYLLDNRSSRQPNKDNGTEAFGHWGELQHQWLVSSLASSDAAPSWLINGDQFFNGKPLTFKESFEGSHPAHFRRLLEDLKKIKVPVVFASGDIHFSEIMKIPQKRGPGYDTYEITSSAMHSYAGEGWDNPLRVAGTKVSEFNFLLIQSRVRDGAIVATTRALGIDPGEYFKVNFEVKKATEP
ncbi:MAG: alkaline phosphatase family protein [Bdellovibrionaceae bacterium]|nr:alkaline phosphatase family protein [Pseudobdellovibrionaceae bacterium]